VKPVGFLSADHQHTAEAAFLETMTAGNLFALQSRNGQVFNFRKA